MTLPFRSASNLRSTVNVRTRAIFCTSSSSVELRKFFARRSSNMLSIYACSAASRWLSLFSASPTCPCFVVNHATPRTTATGIASTPSSWSQSQSVFAGWYCSMFGPLCSLKPVQSHLNIYPAMISTTTPTSNTIAPTTSKSLLLFCRHERNLDAIAPTTSRSLLLFCHHERNLDTILYPFCPLDKLV